LEARRFFRPDKMAIRRGEPAAGPGWRTTGPDWPAIGRGGPKAGQGHWTIGPAWPTIRLG
jgi:hypothetical protein